MAIDIGDAILYFTGDETQLLASFDRVEAEATGKLAPAAAAVEEVGTQFTATGKAAAVAGEEAVVAGTEIAESMNVAGESARGMTEKFKVSEEMLGIRLPRGVNRFLAELPGVNTAITAAFSAGVVFFLADALVQVSEKISHLIADTFIYTEAMKAADASTAKWQMQLVAIAAATKKANAELEQFGMTAAQKTELAMEKNNAAFVTNTAAITANKDKRADLRSEQDLLIAQTPGFLDRLDNATAHWISLGRVTDQHTKALEENKKAMEDAEGEFNALSQKQQELAREYIVLQLQLRDQEDAALKQRLQKQQTYNDAIIRGSQIVGAASLALEKAHADAIAATDDESGVKRLQIGQAYENASYELEVTGRRRKHAAAVQFENEMYQLELKNLENRIAVEKTLGPLGVLAAKATQVQIEQLTRQHHLQLATEDANFAAETEATEKNRAAKLVQSYADMMAKVHAIIKQGVQTISSDATWTPLEKEAIKTATAVEKAFQTLGVTPVTQLEAALKIATQAYNTLSKSGVASAHDLQKAYLGVLQTQLEYDKAIGNTAGMKADQKAIDDTIKTLQKFEGETKKTQGFWDAFSADFKKKAHDDGTASQQMGKMIGDSLKQMQQGFESSIAAALLSEDSFVAGLEKATAATLAQLSAQAAVKAIYFTAMGIAELATGFSDSSAAEWFAAAAEMGLVAGAAGGAAYGLKGGGGSGSSGSGSSKATITQNASTQAGGATTSSVNVPHLFSGAIVDRPTPVVVGDDGRGGSQVEGVFPLGDMRAHAELAKLFGGSGAGDTHYHFNIQGMIGASNVAQLERMVTRRANTGRGNITVRNAGKVTRRS